MQSEFADVLRFYPPRLRQRWLPEESDVPTVGHCTDTKFKAAGSKGIPKMAVLYDLVISRISTEMCALAFRSWSARYENPDDVNQFDLMFQMLRICSWFIPVYNSWCQVTAYVNHFDPYEDNVATRGGERIYLVSICLLLGATYNMSVCATKDDPSDPSIGLEAAQGCAVYAGFMSAHRFWLGALSMITWCLLRPEDRRQARVYLTFTCVHGCITGLLLATQTVVMAYGITTTHSGRLYFSFGLVCIDMFFPFCGACLPPASFLPADLSLWVQRCETLFKAGLANVLMAAVAANFRHQGSFSKARHMAGYVTPVYAYAFKVLYFDYTANVCSVYVDPGNWKFMCWILLHVPLMLTMIMLGVSLTEELRKFHEAHVARILLPRAAFVALLSTALLESLMTRRTHGKSRVSRSVRIIVRMVCGVPLFLLPPSLNAYALLWIPAVLLLFIAFLDRLMRTKRQPEAVGSWTAPDESFVSTDSRQFIELA